MFLEGKRNAAFDVDRMQHEYTALHSTKAQQFYVHRVILELFISFHLQGQNVQQREVLVIFHRLLRRCRLLPLRLHR